MLQVVEMTLEEKRKMYKKLKKSEIVEMLINANIAIESMSKYASPTAMQPLIPPYTISYTQVDASDMVVSHP
jgi:hypothetical protein